MRWLQHPWAPTAAALVVVVAMAATLGRSTGTWPGMLLGGLLAAWWVHRNGRP